MRLALVLLALSGFLALQSAPSSADVAARPGWQVRETRFAYDDLVERLKDAIKAEGMLLVTQASASDGARGQGIVIPGNRVLGVYRNDFARRMLVASVAAGIEAPIRFYVTETGAGTSTLSWKTPSFVFEPYMQEGGADLKTLAGELDNIFLAIAKRATVAE